MNKKFTRNDDDDEMFFSPMKGPLGFTVNTRQMHNFSVHINEEIKSPDYYSKIFDMLIDAGEADMVTFFVCSPGGRVDGLNVLLEGIRMTEAHTVAVLLGECIESHDRPGLERLLRYCARQIAGNRTGFRH